MHTFTHSLSSVNWPFVAQYEGVSPGERRPYALGEWKAYGRCAAGIGRV